MAYDNGFSKSFGVFILNEIIKFDMIYGISLVLPELSNLTLIIAVFVI